jgi:hypothetical protein
MMYKIFLTTEMLQQGGQFTWVWLLVFLVIVLIVALAAIWNARRSGDDVIAHEASAIHSELDDLTKIEGIGPKIASIFQATGITTFTKLAESDVSKLQQILDDEDIRLGDPTTWPQQASLAASGDWEALQKLQDELQGGRAT